MTRMQASSEPVCITVIVVRMKAEGLKTSMQSGLVDPVHRAG
jgi:hypothetical protein